MRIAKWMLALMALLACGLIAVGCGDDDDASSTSDETATEESSSSGDSSSSGVDADAFLSECEDAFAGTPGEDAAATACQQAADALEQCGQQAEAAGGDDSAVEAAVQICQDAADEAVKQLEAANP